jgi:hypothetical protein
MHNDKNAGREQLTLHEIVRAELLRASAEGGYEDPIPLCVGDLIVTTGRNYIAQRIINEDATASRMAYMAVGTVSTGAALGDTTLTGEVKRKALSVSTVGATASNVYTAISTFGGAADTLTGVVIQEAGIFNHASSGQGTMMQRVTFSQVTLADSDLLKITLETNVGSS